MNHRDHCACVVDLGLYTSLAVRLAKDFGKVYYMSEWQEPFAKSKNQMVGKGLPGVTRIENIWDVKDEVDLFLFPDIYDGPLQRELVRQGKRVWGSMDGDELEILRAESKEHMKALGLNVGPYEVVTGMDALRKYLQKNEDRYVKIPGYYRGDAESFHSPSYDYIEPVLNELECTLGPFSKLMPFIVEESLPEAVEVGYDGYCVDGQYPKLAMVGIEVKDASYVLRVMPYTETPQQLQDVNDALADTFKKYKYHNWFSSEVRITEDGDAYPLDLTCRQPSPPGELEQLMWKNLADIVWFGAEGKCIDPEPAGEWGAEIILKAKYMWTEENWMAVEIPKGCEDNVTLRSDCVIDGVRYIIPTSAGAPEFGSIVAVGDTMQEAIDLCKEIAEKIDGCYIDKNPGALDDANAEIEKLSEFGIDL